MKKIYTLSIKALFILIPMFLIGCTAEGNSRFLSKGVTQYYLTMNSCNEEALSEYKDGGKKYSAYECREMLLGIFVLETKIYE